MNKKERNKEIKQLEIQIGKLKQEVSYYDALQLALKLV